MSGLLISPARQALKQIAALEARVTQIEVHLERLAELVDQLAQHVERNRAAIHDQGNAMNEAVLRIERKLAKRER